MEITACKQSLLDRPYLREKFEGDMTDISPTVAQQDSLTMYALATISLRYKLGLDSCYMGKTYGEVVSEIKNHTKMDKVRYYFKKAEEELAGLDTDSTAVEYDSTEAAEYNHVKKKRDTIYWK